QEIQNRMGMLGGQGDQLTVLNYTKTFPERFWRANPHTMLGGDFSPEETYVSFNLPSEVMDKTAGEVEKLRAGLSGRGAVRTDNLIYLYRNYLNYRHLREMNLGVFNTFQFSPDRKREYPDFERLAERVGLTVPLLTWNMVPDLWEPFMGIMDQGYMFTHQFGLKKAEVGSKRPVMGNFVYLPLSSENQR
ncbi:MAG: hypothetical protein K8R69_07430, partial [Deltaproteobacteria bacterium]|nr:hypothetical protein [Deltaproteobacteria bacterium]